MAAASFFFDRGEGRLVHLAVGALANHLHPLKALHAVGALLASPSLLVEESVLAHWLKIFRFRSEVYLGEEGARAQRCFQISQPSCR